MLNTNILKKSLIVTFALGLTACANTEGLETSVTNLTNKVDSLSSQVNALSRDVTSLKAQQQASSEDAKAAKMAAEQANERIDNVVATYKK